MKQHGAFMNKLLAQGLIVAHGPVMDEAGPYGVPLHQIEDDQEVAALTSQDPIVRTGWATTSITRCFI